MDQTKDFSSFGEEDSHYVDAITCWFVIDIED